MWSLESRQPEDRTGDIATPASPAIFDGGFIHGIISTSPIQDLRIRCVWWEIEEKRVIHLYTKGEKETL